MHRFYLLFLSCMLLIFTLDASAATAPGPPSSPSAVAVSPTQINLFWAAPSNDGQSSITGYKIEYKVGSGTYSVLTPSTPNTSYQHTGLSTGQTYYYRISAINSVGTGSASSEVSATPTSSSTASVPSAPRDLSAAAASPTSVNLFWLPPSNNGGYPITGYKIEYRIGSGTYSVLVANTGSESTTYSHTGLTTNQVYVYKVSAITQFGTGLASSEAQAQPRSTSTVSPPSAPSSLSATAISPTQVHLSWTAPTSNGGAPITGYKIEYKVGSGTYTVLVSSTGSTSTSYTHGSLQTETSYSYKVSAINSAGASSTSNEASATPTSTSSAGVPSAPLSLNAAASSPTQINLTWSPPSNNGGYPITGYKIEYKVGSGTYTVLEQNAQGTTYSHTGVTSSQSYTYRVSAINSLGTGSPSNESTATPATANTVPSEPRNLAALPASSTQINLSWAAPSNNGGSQILGYRIEFQRNSGPYEVLVSNTQSTSTSFTHTGLASGSTYNYRVSAINSSGVGAASEASAKAQDTLAPTLVATDVSPTSIMLSWVPPSQTYKQSITGYQIQQKVAPDTYVTIQEQVTSTSYTITGLTTGNTYTYVIFAHYTLGSSPLSNEASATPTSTSTPPSSQPAANPPSAPTGLSATPISPTQVNLSWSAPSDTGSSPITGYRIDVKRGTGSFETLTSNTQNSTTKYSHTNLTTGTAYAYKVYAITSAGTGPSSAEASATPTSTSAPPQQATPPSPPSLSAVLVSPTQVNLSWLPPTNTGGSPITGYKIEYKIGTGSFFSLNNNVSGTTYSHTGILPNTYSYRVYAVNSAGSSIPSNQVTVDAAPEQPPAEQPPVEQPPPEQPPAEQPPAEPEKPKVASFVDPNRDPMHYVDRYNNEPDYKAWFDRNFPGQTIYEAVGLQDPNKKKIITTHIPGFPDPEKDPQYYIDRYNNEPDYKAWFDRNFPGKTIHQVLEVPESKPPEKLQCGPGTKLEGNTCVLDKKENGGGCLIATAAYGSELAPQVQMLREVRDNTLYKTTSGTAFLTAFNQFYYSFSPTVADWERNNPVFKEAVKIAITPMLHTLSILDYADVTSESAILGYGIGILLMNAGMYVGIPLSAFVIARRMHAN
jgi:fibronectin type 3 domain-containing protein